MASLRLMTLLAALSIVTSACGSVEDPTPSIPSVAVSPGAPSAGPRSCPPTSPAAADEPWWTDRVFYEVFVRSFADSDGDGIGDLRGLTARLDYLNDGDPATSDDLGVTALWLMPIAASPSYHGYDVTDYRTIEPDYGTDDDLRALIDAAHQRGIEVIVDLVLNHTSIEHPWFVDARVRGSDHEDWYVWSDTLPAVSGPGGRPVWHRDGDRYYYGYFWSGMPDLKVAEPAVSAEIDAIARYWLEDLGVAGFRIDAARHLIEDGNKLENTPATLDWLAGFRSRTQAADPSALVLGEVWDATSNTSRYVRDGALDLTFEFALAAQVLAAVRSGDAASLRIIQREVTNAYPPGGYASFLTNHDQDRVMDVVGRDLSAARQAATLLLTGPGIPFVYYGEELGLRGRKPDERIRTPMPWTADGPGFGFTTGTPWEAMAEGTDIANVAAQAAEPGSLLAHYRELIALRDRYPALRPGGSLTPLDASDRAVYAILRHDPLTGGAVAVVSNLSDEPVADVVLSSDDGPLCGTPTATRLAPMSVPIEAPTVNGRGGLESWRVGALDPHEDLIVALR